MRSWRSCCSNEDEQGWQRSSSNEGKCGACRKPAPFTLWCTLHWRAESVLAILLRLPCITCCIGSAPLLHMTLRWVLLIHLLLCNTKRPDQQQHNFQVHSTASLNPNRALNPSHLQLHQWDEVGHVSSSTRHQLSRQRPVLPQPDAVGSGVMKRSAAAAMHLIVMQDKHSTAHKTAAGPVTT